MTLIEWTDATWNPWLGCHKVSPGCRNCYAERITENLMGRRFDEVRRSRTTFDAPLRWKEPCLVFTCSMSDFFHPDADAWRDEAWDIIRRTPQHTYQVLTKRPERLAECLPPDWGKGWPHVWLGTSVEMQEYVTRICDLVETPAKVHFLSLEPLLGPILLDFDPYCAWFTDVEWVITGGESGPPDILRPASPDWFRDIRDQCRSAGVPFFHKQNGGSRKCKCHGAWGCRLLDGRTHDATPEVW